MKHLKVVSQFFGSLKQIESAWISCEKQDITFQIKLLEADSKFYARKTRHLNVAYD